MDQKVEVPTLISYQIPYYYFQLTGQLIEYTQNPIPGQLYLVIDYDLWKYQGKTLYKFSDLPIQHEWSVLELSNKDIP